METTFRGLRRSGLILRPDPSRVLLRPFLPAGDGRIQRIVERVCALDDAEVEALWARVLLDFDGRHRDLETFVRRRCDAVAGPFLPEPIHGARQALLGAYFTQEYALEGAALFNPSLVWHPDQSGLEPGARRFVLSLRATGEGHLSSIVFRSGVVDAFNRLSMEAPTRFVTGPAKVSYPVYERALFERKLRELGHWDEHGQAALRELRERFTFDELHAAIERVRPPGHGEESVAGAALHCLTTLARANYEVAFSDRTPLSERVLFPLSPTEINGMEDARFVRFHEDDGRCVYYATYTAYDGKVAMPQLLQTADFARFAMRTLNGSQIQNKGMALFPRRIHGKYALLSRQDNENLFLMLSDNIDFWYERATLLTPRYPWEFVQLGNCGSPLETEAGWLVLTHGVGPMRQYAIGAILLDRDDPSRVLGRLRKPLLVPHADEREGYVPNVVYSCGAQIHGQALILPYAMSDSSSSLAVVPLAEILSALT